MQVKTERGVLPEDHPERLAVRLGLAISALEREDSRAATSILEAYMDDEEERISKVSMSHDCQCPSRVCYHIVGKQLNGRAKVWQRAVL